ncbi:hypothetical protein Pcinc_011514 [Petrolisthes cinctipes]|uniref:Uncharacterized protein n=1 Tax=Petrolisthes cinctipes TaxID=88211 RepID=A0AAE1G6R9_PETCI|nr:hypothetical protein Pcinc_011514 [Petrolisthes cinctipes]
MSLDAVADSSGGDSAWSGCGEAVEVMVSSDNNHSNQTCSLIFLVDSDITSFQGGSPTWVGVLSPPPPPRDEAAAPAPAPPPAGDTAVAPAVAQTPVPTRAAEQTSLPPSPNSSQPPTTNTLGHRVVTTSPHRRLVIGNLRSLSRSFLDDELCKQSILSQGGLSMFRVTGDMNNTEWFQQLAHSARQVRQRSWCSVVVVVSESRTFLATLANWSLKGRLLVWATRLLVVTRLTLPHLHSLLSSHWTFSMMNTIFLNLEQPRPNLRCVVYSHLPYTAAGFRKVVRLAYWTPSSTLTFFNNHTLFPEKFTNFFGDTVNVSALPFMPFWGEVVEGVASDDGSSSVTRYTGSDYYLLITVANALNFTVRIIKPATWFEVCD